MAKKGKLIRAKLKHVALRVIWKAFGMIYCPAIIYFLKKMTVAQKFGFTHTQGYTGDGPTAWKEPWVHLSPAPVQWLKVDRLKLAIKAYLLHKNWQMEQVNLFICFLIKPVVKLEAAPHCPNRACFPKLPWLWLDSSHLSKVLYRIIQRMFNLYRAFIPNFFPRGWQHGAIKSTWLCIERC